MKGVQAWHGPHLRCAWSQNKHGHRLRHCSLAVRPSSHPNRSHNPHTLTSQSSDPVAKYRPVRHSARQYTAILWPLSERTWRSACTACAGPRSAAGTRGRPGGPSCRRSRACSGSAREWGGCAQGSTEVQKALWPWEAEAACVSPVPAASCGGRGPAAAAAGFAAGGEAAAAGGVLCVWMRPSREWGPAPSSVPRPCSRGVSTGEAPTAPSSGLRLRAQGQQARN